MVFFKFSGKGRVRGSKFVINSLVKRKRKFVIIRKRNFRLLETVKGKVIFDFVI